MLGMQDPAAATKVVQLAAADPTVLASATGIITAVKTSALAGGLSGIANLNVQHLAADPTVLAAIVPFIEAGRQRLRPGMDGGPPGHSCGCKGADD